MEWIPFLPQIVKAVFGKIFYQLNFRGRIVARQYFRNRKRVMIADSNVRFESAADHFLNGSLVLPNLIYFS